MLSRLWPPTRHSRSEQTSTLPWPSRWVRIFAAIAPGPQRITTRRGCQQGVLRGRWRADCHLCVLCAYASPRIQSDTCSPIMMQVRLMFARGIVGMTDASTTRRFGMLRSRQCWSTTDRRPGPSGRCYRGGTGWRRSRGRRPRARRPIPWFPPIAGRRGGCGGRSVAGGRSARRGGRLP